MESGTVNVVADCSSRVPLPVLGKQHRVCCMCITNNLALQIHSCKEGSFHCTHLFINEPVPWVMINTQLTHEEHTSILLMDFVVEKHRLQLKT
jgi:hypothetical protein